MSNNIQLVGGFQPSVKCDLRPKIDGRGGFAMHPNRDAKFIEFPEALHLIHYPETYIHIGTSGVIEHYPKARVSITPQRALELAAAVRAARELKAERCECGRKHARDRVTALLPTGLPETQRYSDMLGDYVPVTQGRRPQVTFERAYDSDFLVMYLLSEDAALGRQGSSGRYALDEARIDGLLWWLERISTGELPPRCETCNEPVPRPGALAHMHTTLEPPGGETRGTTART